MDNVPDSPSSFNCPPQSAQWFLKVQGGCVEVTRHLNFSRRPRDRSRGHVGDFSRFSRMRLLRAVAHIDWPKLGKSLFVTLTYPDSVGDTDYVKRRRHRYLFMRYVEAHLGRHVPTFWRVEWKARKSGAKIGRAMPHIHLLLGGVEFIGHARLRKFWRAIVHVNGALCTDVQSVDAAASAVAYLCKYTSKSPSLDIGAYLNNESGVGRHWGFTRKHLFRIAPIERLQELTDEQAGEARQIASDVFPGYDDDLGGGFTLFGADSLEAIQSLCKGWD